MGPKRITHSRLSLHNSLRTCQVTCWLCFPSCPGLIPPPFAAGQPTPREGRGAAARRTPRIPASDAGPARPAGPARLRPSSSPGPRAPGGVLPVGTGRCTCGRARAHRGRLPRPLPVHRGDFSAPALGWPPPSLLRPRGAGAPETPCKDGSDQRAPILRAGARRIWREMGSSGWAVWGESSPGGGPYKGSRALGVSRGGGGEQELGSEALLAPGSQWVPILERLNGGVDEEGTDPGRGSDARTRPPAARSASWGRAEPGAALLPRAPRPAPDGGGRRRDEAGVRAWSGRVAFGNVQPGPGVRRRFGWAPLGLWPGTHRARTLAATHRPELRMVTPQVNGGEQSLRPKSPSCRQLYFCFNTERMVHTHTVSI